MAFTTNGFQPASVEYLEVGKKYQVRINNVQVKQFVEQQQIVDKLEVSFDVHGVRVPRPNSMNFKSRPATNEKNAQTRWDEKLTRFKEIFGIAMNDDNFANWKGKVGELEVASFRDTPFFNLPKKVAGEVTQQVTAPATPAPAAAPVQQSPKPAGMENFQEDIPF